MSLSRRRNSLMRTT